jgi:hypothetical protein
VYKNDPVFDFSRMLALNGFNKWPSRFGVNFKHGNHIKNIKLNLADMRKFQTYVEDMIRQWKSHQQILDGLRTTVFL